MVFLYKEIYIEYFKFSHYYILKNLLISKLKLHTIHFNHHIPHWKIEESPSKKYVEHVINNVNKIDISNDFEPWRNIPTFNLVNLNHFVHFSHLMLYTRQ